LKRLKTVFVPGIGFTTAGIDLLRKVPAGLSDKRVIEVRQKMTSVNSYRRLEGISEPSRQKTTLF
jgi:hypothetical protein